MAKPEPVAPNISQSDKFIEAARDLGCYESEEAFAEVVRKVAKQPPTAEQRKVLAKHRSKE